MHVVPLHRLLYLAVLPPVGLPEAVLPSTPLALARAGVNQTPTVVSVLLVSSNGSWNGLYATCQTQWLWPDSSSNASAC